MRYYIFLSFIMDSTTSESSCKGCVVLGVVKSVVSIDYPEMERFQIHFGIK